MYIVRDADARDVRALVSHLSVPISQIRVGDLSRHIEDHNADMRAEVICRMQLIERFLTSRVPNVYINAKTTMES